MSVYYTVNLERRVEGFDPGTGFYSDYVLMAINVADETGVPSIAPFVSKLFEEYLDEAPPADMVDRWFTPEEGKQWSSQLRQELAKRPTDGDIETMLSCLDEFDEKMRFAESIQSRWNFFAF